MISIYPATAFSHYPISYAYWPDGSRWTMSVAGLPTAFSYTYDAAGRQTGLTNPFSEASSWQYLNNSWLWKQTLANGAVTAYTYNARGFITDQQTQNGGTLLSDFGGQTYNGVGDRTKVTANLPVAPAVYSGTTSYGYDQGQTGNPALNRSQLTQETSTRSGGYNNVLGYDGGISTGPGNPTTFRGTSRTFNADNQDTANTYDGNGNPTTYNGSSLQFDPENRMTQFGSAVTNTYTGDGLRAKKTVSSGAGSVWFVYDSDQPICEMDSGGNLTAINTWGANGLVSRRTSGTTLFYNFDPSGNGSLLLDGNANVVASSVSDGFGNTFTTVTGDPYFGFGGQWGYYQDAQDGLNLLGHRFYDSSTQRFLTRDPIGYRGGINLYAYTANNPVNNTDATGLFPVLTEPAPPPGIIPILEAGGGTGLGTVLLTMGGVVGGVLGIAGPAGPVNEFPITDPRNSQRIKDHNAYKRICNESPPSGLNRCQLLLWTIERDEKCIAAKKAWDAKYEPGRHDTDTASRQRGVDRRKAEYSRLCCGQS